MVVSPDPLAFEESLMSAEERASEATQIAIRIARLERALCSVNCDRPAFKWSTGALTSHWIKSYGKAWCVRSCATLRTAMRLLDGAIAAALLVAAGALAVGFFFTRAIRQLSSAWCCPSRFGVSADFSSSIDDFDRLHIVCLTRLDRCHDQYQYNVSHRRCHSCVGIARSRRVSRQTIAV